MDKEKQRSRTLSVFAVCFVIGALCLGVFIFVFHNFVFVIKNVNVEGSVKSDVQNIVYSSGIETGEPMYSINKSEISNKIKRENPYVESVSIKRDLPSDIRMIVTESTPQCFVFLADEYFILSGELRVLEYTEDPIYANSIAPFCIVLPEVSRMILGEEVSFFSGTDHAYIFDVIKSVQASKLSDRIELVSVKNKFGIYAVCDGMYRIEFGSAEDIAIKLEVAYAIMDSGKLEGGIPAAIDVSNTTEAHVISDKNLILAPDVQK